MKPHYRSRKRRFPLYQLLLIGLLLVLSGAQEAESQTRVTLDAESQLWIEGSSSVNTFTCEAGTLDGSGVFDTQDTPVKREAVAEVHVPVRRFDCGKARMNDDLYQALQAEAHPQIRFLLSEAELTAPSPTQESTHGLSASPGGLP